MKQVAIFAGLAVGMAAANHNHHQHHHEHVRRGDDGIVTSWDLTTKWEYVTVTAGQAQPSSAPAPPAPPAGNQGKAVDSNAGAGAGDNVQAQAIPKAAPTAAAANDPNAIQASLIAAQNSKIAAQQAINSAQMSRNNAPQGTGAPVAPSVPVQQPAPSYKASSAASPAQPSQPAQTGGGSTGGGEWHTAIGTYYGAQGGYGSCGDVLSDNGHTVAISSSLMGSKQNCGKTITIQTDSGTYQATVADTCPGCTEDGGYGHIDIVQGWAHEIDPNIEQAGHANLKWKFN